MKKDLCPLCGGNKKESTTIFTIDYKKGVIVVREVPAFVCEQCGEEWLSDEVTSKLEEIVSLAKKQQQEIFIAKYKNYLLAS